MTGEVGLEVPCCSSEARHYSSDWCKWAWRSLVVALKLGIIQVTGASGLGGPML